VNDLERQILERQRRRDPGRRLGLIGAGGVHLRGANLRLPGEDLGEVQDRFKSHLLKAATADPWLSEHPPQISFYAFLAEGCIVYQEAQIFVPLRERHRSVMGGDLDLLAFTATTDSRFFNLYHNIPATCYGPIGASLHAPDEWVDLESVKNVTKVLALTTMDWCGVA
jgi:acetylornithine deacetylase